MRFKYVLEYLFKHFVINEVHSKDFFDPRIYSILLENIKNYNNNQNENPKLRCFVISKDNNSERFYEDKSTWDELYLLYDEISGYMESNSGVNRCNKLLRRGLREKALFFHFNEKV